jgi:hypothetical protein
MARFCHLNTVGTMSPGNEGGISLLAIAKIVSGTARISRAACLRANANSMYQMRRWTDGDAVLPLPPFNGQAMLEVHLAGEMTYVVTAEPAPVTQPQADPSVLGSRNSVSAFSGDRIQRRLGDARGGH